MNGNAMPMDREKIMSMMTRPRQPTAVNGVTC